MIAYKGFLPGLICRGYQFRMGLNVTEKANCAHNGFHCAEDPLDCLRYYPGIHITIRKDAVPAAGIPLYSKPWGAPGIFGQKRTMLI